MTVHIAPAAGPRVIASGGATAWCVDADTRDNIRARRNVLAGLWAGRLMRIPNHQVQSYATAAHYADFGEPGDEDLVDKLFRDLSLCGVAITREEVRRKLSELHRQAMMQTCQTD
jgi:hypothetical protein